MKIDITEEPQAEQLDSSELDEQALIDEAIAQGTQAAEEALEQEKKEKEQQESKTVDDLLDTIDRLEQELASRDEQLNEAQVRADEATDKYVRLYASWENFRKRTEAERKVERTRATQGLASHLIVVLDDIDRALEHGKEYVDNPDFAGFLAGFEAVRTKFVDALAKEHVAEINPVGEPFDALAHQAVSTVENTQEYDETVCTVFQKGYRMGDYVLRPAMVQITQGGPTRPADAKEQEQEQADVSRADQKPTPEAEVLENDVTSDDATAEVTAES